MSWIRNRGRVAGFLYLLLVLSAPLRLMYIPGSLFVRGDATATAANIAANEWLFRFGILADLFTGVIVIFVTLALYRLFESVDRNLAVLMVILGSLMVTPIYFLNTLNDAAALMLIRGADFLSAFDKPQRDALALLFLRQHHQGTVVNQVFWGLWLFPLGILVRRSGIVPRILGLWLILNGFAYLVQCATGLLLPRYEGAVFNSLFPATLAEVAFMLWLLIKGARTNPAP